MTNKTTAKFFNVAIDYRSAGWNGAHVGTVKADNKDDAIAIVERELRAKYINLTIDRASAAVSGWSH
jgi:hypothetical protein